MKNLTLRAEHPNPSFRRNDFINLNGEWDFEIDNEFKGESLNFSTRPSLNSKITVPFCPESELSGIGIKDFMKCLWYRKTIFIPEDFAGKRVILHIGACDYETKIFVNGNQCGDVHYGGYTPIACDITEYLTNLGNNLVICVKDDTTSKNQETGKQSKILESKGTCYTRTTGIWQTVYLEAHPLSHIQKYNAVSDIENGRVNLTVETENAIGGTLTATAYFNKKKVGEVTTRVNSNSENLTIPLDEIHLWDIGQGNLYDLALTLCKDGVCDSVDGYFGLREVGLEKDGFYLNGRRVFLRAVLDQGFYRDGIYTAKDEESLISDIKNSMALGFNGARLHEKVFEPLYLYHADRLGYLVFGETPNWGLDHTIRDNIYNFLPQWIEEVERDLIHPSIVGWCPFNETWDREGRQQSNDFINLVYSVTKSIDKTRPVFTNSGSFPCKSDVHDVHDYEQDTDKFRENYAHIDKGIVNCQLTRKFPDRMFYDESKPIFVSEYGGIGWIKNDGSDGWGYGKSVKSEEEFFTRLEKLTDTLLENKYIIGFCYTQLYDVEQEKNGLLTYDRQFKFAPEKLHRIFAKKSVIED